MKKELILLRGLPGSGKTSLAKLIGGSHYEADMYFTVNGKYQFNASKLKLAHNWCLIQVQKTMVEDEPKIIVSNTFTQEWEMEPYYEMAKRYGYRVFSLVVENRHSGVNEHGVPGEKIQQMANRFEIKLK